MADSDAEKKHDPTDRQWADAALKGQIPKSAEVLASLTMLAGVWALVRFNSHLVDNVSAAWVRCWSASDTITVQSATHLLWALAGDSAKAVAITLMAASMAALGLGLAMTQGQTADDVLEMKPERLDLFKNFQQIFGSATPWMELVKNLLRLSLVVGAAWYAVRDDVAGWPRLAAIGPSALADELVRVSWDVLTTAVPVMLFIGVGDYAWSWWRMFQDLKRTDEQVKEDHKASEGDPRVKQQRRQRGRELLRRNGGLRKVKTAHVVITNPTHYAVALRYERGKDKAPVVVAKGVDHLAALIREEARRNGIPKIEDRMLARGLYARAHLGRPIPESLFGPVARVLAVVMARRRATKPR